MHVRANTLRTRSRSRRLAPIAVFSAAAILAGGGASAATKTTKKSAAKTTAKGAATTAAPTTAAPATSTDGLDPNATLRLAFSVPPAGWDPTDNIMGQNRTALSLAYDRLTQWAYGRKIAPMLAKSWDFAADNTSVTFHLRDDVKFQDGTKFTSQAVKLSLERAVSDPKRASAALFNMIKSVDAVDDYTVRINVTRPSLDLPAQLSQVNASIISPAGIKGDLAKAPAGSGAFKVVQFEAGNKAVFERNTDYWDKDAAKVKRIEYYGVPSDDARVNGLRAGQYDIIKGAPTTILEERKLAATGNYKIYEYSIPSYWAFLINTDKAPYDNEQLRKAISYAIDRTSIAKTVFNGLCVPATQPLLKDMPGYNAKIEGDYAYYSTAKSKQILSSSGFANGIKLTAGAGNTSGYDTLAVVVQAELKEVGIDLDLKIGDLTPTTAAFTSGQIPANIGTKGGNVNASLIMDGNFLSGSRYFPGKSPDELSQMITSTYNPQMTDAVRAQTMQKASEYIMERALEIPICHVIHQFTATNQVVNAGTMGTADVVQYFDMRYLGMKASS